MIIFQILKLRKKNEKKILYFLKRFFVFIIDYIFIMIITLPFFYLFNFLKAFRAHSFDLPFKEEPDLLMIVIANIINFLYYSLFLTNSGSTGAMEIFKLKIKDYKSKKYFIYLREIIFFTIFIAPAMFLSYLDRIHYLNELQLNIISTIYFVGLISISFFIKTIYLHDYLTKIEIIEQ